MPNIGLPELIILLLLTIVPIVIAAMVCQKKDYPAWLGVVLAFLLSWLGLIIVLFLPRRAN